MGPQWPGLSGAKTWDWVEAPLVGSEATKCLFHGIILCKALDYLDWWTRGVIYCKQGRKMLRPPTGQTTKFHVGFVLSAWNSAHHS